MATSATRTTKSASKTAGKTTAKSAARSATKASGPEAAEAATGVAGQVAAKKSPRRTATKRAAKTGSGTTATTPKTSAPAGESKTVTLRGRSVFVVQTTSAGVTVRTAWLSEDQKLLEMPAVFPDVNYAVNLIDDLKRQVLKHFSQAAQVGAQAIASQKASKKSGN